MKIKFIENTYNDEFVSSWFSVFLLSSLIILPYLISFIYEAELYYFLVTAIVIIALIALINFRYSLYLIPLVLTNPYTLKETNTNLHISEIVLLVIFIVWYLRIISLREKLIIPKEICIPIFIIICFGILSLVISKNQFYTLLQLIRFFEILFILVIILFNYINKPEHLRIIFFLLIIGGLIASLVGIEQFFSGSMVKGTTRRVFGWHGGGYGAILASTIIMSISALVYEKKWIRFISLITIPIVSFAMILSQTRAWLLALLISIVITFFMKSKKALKNLFFFSIGLILFIFIFILTDGFGLLDLPWFNMVLQSALSLNRLSGGDIFQDVSMFLRFNVWKYTIMLTIANPLIGIGLGNLRFVDYINIRLGTHGEGVGYVDNQYLHMFAELGIFAGIAWILIIFRAIKLGYESISFSKSLNLESVVRGFFGSLLVFVVGSVFWVITPHHELFALNILYVVFLIRIFRIIKNEE